MIKIISILLILLLGSIGLLSIKAIFIFNKTNFKFFYKKGAETNRLENKNVNKNEHKIEIPKKVLYSYLIKRAFEGLGKRNLVHFDSNEDEEYLSNEYNKRAFEGLGKRNGESDEYFSNESNKKRAFEGLGKRAFEGLGKRSLNYRVFRRQFDGLGK